MNHGFSVGSAPAVMGEAFDRLTFTSFQSMPLFCQIFALYIIDAGISYVINTDIIRGMPACIHHNIRELQLPGDWLWFL